MEGDGLGQREEKLPGGQDLHAQQRLLREPIQGPLQRVDLSAQLRGSGGGNRRRGAIGSGGIRAVDSEAAIGAAEEEPGAVGSDGVDFGGTVAEELEGIVGAVHHVRASSSPPLLCSGGGGGVLRFGVGRE